MAFDQEARKLLNWVKIMEAEVKNAEENRDQIEE